MPPGRIKYELDEIWAKQDDWPENPETDLITVKPKAVSHVAEQFWVPLPSCSWPGCSFTMKSFGLSVHVSPCTIYFPVLDKGHSLAHPLSENINNYLVICFYDFL